MTGQSSLMTKEEEEDDEENDSFDLDRKSKMSFSYWGADKVTIHKPAVKPLQTSNSSRKGALSPLGYGHESSANAKFGARLLNPYFNHSHPRPASRRTQATPTSRLSRTLNTITRLRGRPSRPPESTEGLFYSAVFIEKMDKDVLEFPALTKCAGIGVMWNHTCACLSFFNCSLF